MTTVLAKDTVYGYQSQEGPSVRELLEGHLGVEFRGSGPRYSVKCPWHDDRSPSLSVDDEKGLFHCFGCGAKGNGWTLAKELGILPEKGVIHPGSSVGWVYKSLGMDAPRWSKPWLEGEEVDAEEVYWRGQMKEGGIVGPTRRDFLAAYRRWLGREEMAEAVEMCGHLGETLDCRDDGDESVFPFHCKDLLCLDYRTRKMKRSVRAFGRRLLEGAEVSLYLGGFPILGDAVPEVVVGAKDRLHEAFERALKKAPVWGLLPGMRLAKESGQWWWKALVAIVGTEAERLRGVDALLKLGLQPLELELGPVSGPVAIKRVAAFAAEGYEGDLTFEDMELVETVLYKRHLIQGRGGFFQKVAAKAKEEAARRSSAVPAPPKPIVGPRPPRLGGGNWRRCHTCGRWGHTGHDLIPLTLCVWVNGHLYRRGRSPADRKMTAAVV